MFNVTHKVKVGKDWIRYGHIGFKNNPDHSYFHPMNDSNKNFKTAFFFVQPLNAAAKKSIAEIQDGKLVKSYFPLSWSRAHHFTSKGHVITNPDYAVEPTILKGDDVESHWLIDKWGKLLARRGKKLHCGLMFDELAKSEAKLKEHFDKCSCFIFTTYIFYC